MSNRTTLASWGTRPPFRSALFRCGIASSPGENLRYAGRRSRWSAASPIGGIGGALAFLTLLAALLSPQAARAQNPDDLLKDPPTLTPLPCTLTQSPVDQTVCVGGFVGLSAEETG